MIIVLSKFADLLRPKQNDTEKNIVFILGAKLSLLIEETQRYSFNNNVTTFQSYT